MFIDGFDQFLPPAQREVNKGPAAFIPQHLRTEIDTLNSWVYDSVNNGVYKAGFAGSQASYNEHVTRLFQAFDRLEYHLGQTGHYPYLFGNYITESDIRLFTTVVRFDVAYYTLFKCNLKTIRADYPRIHDWVRRLYWSDGPETGGGVFKQTTHFDIVSVHPLTVGVFAHFSLDQTWIFGGRCWQWGCTRYTHWTCSSYHAFVKDWRPVL